MKINSIGYQIHLTSRKISGYLNEHLKNYDLTPGQWSVIRVLALEDRICQRELASRCGKDQNNIKSILDKLEKKEYVVRMEDPLDRRIFRIHLTDKVREIINELELVYQEIMNKICFGIKKEELNEFERILEKFRENIDILEEKI